MQAAQTIGRPLTHAQPDVRVEYLQRVMIYTVMGLGVSAVTGTISAVVIAMFPFLMNTWVMMAGILGSYFVAHNLAAKMVFGGNRWAGFGIAAVFQGIAMGYLLLTAVAVSSASLGNPFLLIAQALLLTATTGVGLTAYVWTKPREFKMLGAGLSALFIPMLILMGISFVFPIGGPLGIAISAIFVVVSAGGLLYQVNQVLHRLDTSQTVEGAYLITMGVLVLFWNILTLLMRLQDR